MSITCKQFTDILSRRSEHLDDEILRDITPIMGWIGHVETGRFKAEDGVSHTYDKFRRVFPDLSAPWNVVTAQSCIGTPCDPNEQKIGFGFDRDTYFLMSQSYTTDIFCFDLILSADRAKQQFAFIVEQLRDASSLITSNRMRCEALRLCQDSESRIWMPQSDGSLARVGFQETGDLINVYPFVYGTSTSTAAPGSGTSILPGSKLTAAMLQQRVEPMILRGALAKNIGNHPPLLELVTDFTTLQELKQDTNATDHWRYNEFDLGSKEFYEYGWMGKIGNYAVRCDPHQTRFQINGNVLSRVFPYENGPAFLGIKGTENDAWLNAPVKVHFIWHRRGMISRVQDTTQINPQMPFAARDFAGKWAWAMDNIVCKQSDGTLTPVDNKRRNKGVFYADWRFATQKQFPEYCEAFIALGEPACSVAVLPCKATPDYVPQDYSSANTPCE